MGERQSDPSKGEPFKNGCRKHVTLSHVRFHQFGADIGIVLENGTGTLEDGHASLKFDVMGKEKLIDELNTACGKGMEKPLSIKNIDLADEKMSNIASEQILYSWNTDKTGIETNLYLTEDTNGLLHLYILS
jgi:hypothetical protein